MPEISPHAIVEPSADLADDVRVGPFSYIGPDVAIGPGCVIENNVTVVGRTCLGEDNHVFPMAVLGADEGDETGECVIGTGNTFREHVTVYGGAGEPTRIADGNLIMIGSQIGAGAQIGHCGIFPNFTHIGNRARIEDYVRTSGFTSIGPGVRVGQYTFTAGYAVITRDAPPFAIIWDNPFHVRGVNSENLRRCGFGDGDIRALKSAFRELFNGGAEEPDPAAMERLRTREEVNPHVRHLIEYLSVPAGRHDA